MNAMNKVILLLIFSILTTTSMAQKKIKQTAGRDQLGTFAPKFAELNDDILFGEVWSRTEQLGLRDRSLVTITSLISQGITDSSLTFHLQSAKNNGITRTEIASSALPDRPPHMPASSRYPSVSHECPSQIVRQRLHQS